MFDFDSLRAQAAYDGVAEIGFADLHGIVPERYAHLPFSICLVWKLCNGVVDEIETLSRPSFTYYQHYRSINAALDQLTLKIAGRIEGEGYRALPIGASQSVHDMGEYSGAFQHKTAAVHAGLGFIGKSALFVSHRFGPRVRLASILTDMPLPCPPSNNLTLSSLCGSCQLCASHCPAHAIHGGLYTAGDSRAGIFDPKACSDHMKEAYRNIGRGAVCGICMAVCPYGKGQKPQEA